MSGDALWKAADGSPQKAGDRRSIVKSSKTNSLSQLQNEPDAVSFPYFSTRAIYN